MSPVEVAERLDGRPPARRRPRARSRRHQSLAAAIDWSYRLLPEPEQRLFARLSVFAGGADLRRACTGVRRPGTSPRTTSLDLLAGSSTGRWSSPSSARAQPRYRMLETLRAYGRDRVGPRARPALARRHAELLRRAGRGGRPRSAGPRRAGLGGRRAARLRQPARRVRAGLRRPRRRPRPPAGRVDARARPTCASATRPSSWAERALASPDRSTRCSPPRSAPPRAARGTVGDFARARQLARRADGPRAAARAPRVSPIPADVARRRALYEGDVDRGAAHYTAEVERARADRRPDPAGVDALLRRDLPRRAAGARGAGSRPRRRACAVARGDGQPDRPVDGPLRAGPGAQEVRARPRAGPLRRGGASSPAAVRNFWWEGIALMEAAATRAVHGDPTAGARRVPSIVLDHWDRVGDWTQQWLNLRYIARLLARLGAASTPRPAPLPGRRGQALPVRPAGRAPRPAVGRAGRGAGGLRPRLPRTADGLRQVVGRFLLLGRCLPPLGLPVRPPARPWQAVVQPGLAGLDEPVPPLRHHRCETLC